MRADLARREPEWLARWERERQYETHPRRAPGGRCARVRPARRPALPDGRHPLRHGPEQGPQGPGHPLAAADGQARAVPAGLGLPRPAHRAAGRKRAGAEGQGDGRGGLSRQVRAARAEVRRRHAHRVQAARLPGHLGRPVSDAVEGLRGDHRPPAGRLRARRAHLPRQEAGALVPHAPDGAGRGRGRIRGPHLAVDLRALPGRRRSGQGGPAPARSQGGVRHLDDHPLDDAGQPGRGRQSRAGLRRHSRRRRAADCGGRAGRGVPGGDRHPGARRELDPDPARGVSHAGGDALSAAVPARQGRSPSATTASGSRGTPRWRRAPASCTRRPDTAPTTTSSGAITASRSSRPSTSRGASRPRRLWIPRCTGCGCSRPTPRSSRRWPTAGCC